jgi:hypothetical protein
MIFSYDSWIFAENDHIINMSNDDNSLLIEYRRVIRELIKADLLKSSP